MEELIYGKILFYLSVIGVVFWMSVMSLHVIAIYHAKFYLYSWRKCHKDTINGHTEKIGVSIIKTITANSAAILFNLESVFQLHYPQFELLICVQSPQCDVIPHIEEIMKRYPNVNAKLYTSGEVNVGVNPKINNIMQCYNDIKYQYVWICDSNIYVNEWTLDEMTSHLQPNVGIVHQLPYIYPECKHGHASCLEKIYFGTHHGKWYLVFDFFHAFCTNGMSSIFDKSALDEIGGLSQFSHYIAEDYFIGKSFFDRGYKIILSSEPAYQNIDNITISGFIKRLTRWQKLRLTMLKFSFMEPLIECLVFNLVGSLSMSHFLDESLWTIYLKSLLFWHFLDEVLLWLIEGQCSTLPSLFSRLVMWIFREIVTYWVFVLALWDRRIRWSRGMFDLRFGGQASIIPKDSKQP